MGQLRSYLLALTAAAFLVSLAQALPLKGAARRMVRLACGLFLCLVLLGPLLRLRFGDLRAYLDRFSMPEAGSEAVARWLPGVLAEAGWELPVTWLPNPETFRPL